MCVILFDVPEEILLDLHEEKEDFIKYIKRLTTLDLYKNKRVSLGCCANVADMTKEDFVKYLGVNGISIFAFESENEFLEELAKT